MRTANLFGGEGAYQRNAVWQALADLSRETKPENYIHDTPITTMTDDLIRKLNENGFKVVAR